MRILIIGAAGRVGRAAAGALSEHDIISAGRSHGDVRIDVREPETVRAAMEALGEVDAVVCAAGHAPWGELVELGAEEYRAAFDGKVLPQLELVRLALPAIADGGSITLTTGVLARTPVRTGAAAAMANGAVEAFVRAAAPEVPRGIRLNAVSPTVLAEATSYHETFAGISAVPAARVGEAFQDAVEGDRSGWIYAVD
jgi:NAD(P)-dependent dehydrogenase (short-subunit alcohol dehydrogenase family)